MLLLRENNRLSGGWEPLALVPRFFAEVLNSIVNPCLWKASTVLQSQFYVVTSSRFCKMYSLQIKSCSHPFQFLIHFEGINMRLTWSLKQGHTFQWQKMCWKEGLGPSGDTWASVLDSVVLFHAARWWFLRRYLWQLCGSLPEIHVTWSFGLNLSREVQGEAEPC